MLLAGLHLFSRTDPEVYICLFGILLSCQAVGIGKIPRSGLRFIALGCSGNDEPRMLTVIRAKDGVQKNLSVYGRLPWNLLRSGLFGYSWGSVNRICEVYIIE